jgi:uncharacterized membrane protein (DUF485 family)
MADKVLTGLAVAVAVCFFALIVLNVYVRRNDPELD